MKKKIHFIFVKPLWVYILFVFLLFFSAFRSEKVIITAKNALFLCAHNIIPSLFPFFVFSSVLIYSGFAEFIEKGASFFMRPLFNVGGSGAYAFIIGILSGYPSGAHAICSLYEKGTITKTEAERLLPFCNNSGPLFIIGAVGTTFLNSAHLGVFLYLIHIISAVLVGFVMRFYKRQENSPKNAKNKNYLENKICFSKVFSQSVEKSVSSILNVCGFVIIFSVISAIGADILRFFSKNEFLSPAFSGILEITSGISKISKLSVPINVKLSIVSFFLGFSGICVSLQVAHVLSGKNLGMKTYFFGKILHAGFSAVLCSLLFKYTHITSASTKALALYLPFKYILFVISIIILLSFIYITAKKRKLFQ